MGCDFKEDPVDELQLTSVTGNYGEAYDYLTYLVKMGDGKPRLFPGYTYLACPCDGGCKATVDPYGSPLVPYFGTTKVVPEDFVLKYEYFDLSPAEGFSTKATISGVPCK
jgi:hypothetical protein